jgi:hypothetical protein
MATSPIVRRALALIVVACTAAAGCGGEREATGPPATHTGTTGSTGSTVPPPTGSTPDGTAPVESEVLRFDAPAEVACTTGDTSVRVTYVTRDVTTVAFAVDGQSVTGAAAPLSGEYDVAVPCDGRVHTILLVAVGPPGQAVATRAVRAQPG